MDYYRHPYRTRLAPIGVGVVVYFLLLKERYHPGAVFFAGPKEYSLQGVVDWAIAILLYKGMWEFLAFSALFAGLVVLWLFFFAQFVLPVNTWRERWSAFSRLGYYMVGLHGPAIFIQDGKLIQHKGESRRRGKGVIVLDTASAAVLFTEEGPTRTVGPGVAFTKSGERVTQNTVVDLRTRAEFLGPNVGEDPFAPQREEETNEAYEARQRRRWETSAKTRDGTEVVARVGAIFYLDDHPDGLSEEAYEQGKFHTRFKGHTVSVWRAIIHRPLDAEKASREASGEEASLDWGWLPARMAVDLWREYLQRFRLSDLFVPLEDDKTALQIIVDAIRERMTQPVYREMGVEGTWTGARLPSREYALLQERGIRIQAVAIPTILLPEAAEKTLVEKWAANWLMYARKEREMVEHQRLLAKKRGEEAADVLWGTLMVERICADAQQQHLTREQCLERILRHLRGVIQSDPALYQAQKSDMGALEAAWAWARDLLEEEDDDVAPAS